MEVTVELLNSHALSLLKDLEQMNIIRFTNQLEGKIPKVKKQQRSFGAMKGLVKYMSPDFNAPLEDFKDYM
jgi:Protein of unknown function (DUF2281)